ncbi:TetR family transcriptional regulator [Arthrobacter sp. MYb224]|uniref:TetR family transcriptional regulator n=1 Tax=Micrococcales TaxID=85006 RepID=UPI000CFD859C|nr:MULTISPECIES: TetR family transcriptional regulator [Micrococcales]MCF2571856.1 TetR family transcriptional regulator [Brevibacterium sp. UCMA 11754]PRA01419.1 TetR family transcriptional regulator [Arthrobacter sp. MYb224]PRA06389.1 TetR family transcriptional regulator [Arthrobacter sp. MYb229]PRB53291.1 TetR family transcriptional regulator [Arthrobacter sp. MYb216]
MPPDATDTKRRILVAARGEFAQFGLAGARVDRIAKTGRVNKRSIYVHFGPKDQLFDLVVATALTEMAEEVPFTAEDLPSYAGALFDYLTARPEVLRLTTWAGLERADASQGEVQAYAPKVAALSESFDDAAVDVLALLLGQITAWQFASSALRAHAAEGPWSTERLRRHRILLIASVEALVSVAEGSVKGSPSPS